MNLDSILRIRDIILLIKVHIVKAMVFPVVKYGCESWTIKKADRWDVLELWCWRRLLRVPWTERRSNQSILKEIIPEYSLEGLILKLKLQYFDAKRPFTGKDPDAAKDWGQEEKRTTEDQMVGWHHWFNGHEFEQALGDGEGQTGKHSVLQSMGWQRVRHDSVTELIEATFTSLHFTSNYKRIQKFKAKL